MNIITGYCLVVVPLDVRLMYFDSWLELFKGRKKRMGE